MTIDALLLFGVLLIPLTLLLVSVGCGLDTYGTLPPYYEQVHDAATLVSYWRLGDKSGDPALDAKDGNHGTYHGGVTHRVPGLLTSDPDPAASFDGTSGYVSVPFSAALNPPKFTLEALVKPTAAVGKNTSRAILSLFSKDGTHGCGLYIGDNEKWQLWLADGTKVPSGPVAESASTVIYDVTTYLAGTFDGGTAKLYVDYSAGGADVPSAKSLTYGPNADGASELRIGAGANDTPVAEFFAGVIDEVAVHNDVLDDTTISLHYAGNP
ncbi:MAG: hypothetical protein NVS1B9_01090 [Solirubrobacteraceae bacterium]